MVKQMTFATAKGFEVHGRATRKAEFLARMEMLVPWAQFCAVIEPHYPKAGNGRPPVGLERMFRMYLLANWFNLGDEACEDAPAPPELTLAELTNDLPCDWNEQRRLFGFVPVPRLHLCPKANLLNAPLRWS